LFDLDGHVNTILTRWPVWERIRRFGKYRIVNAECRWGVDLFDDLARLAVPRGFRITIDVGANEGAFSKLLLVHCPSAIVHAFEPVPATFNRLKQNLSANPRVRLHPLAASNRTGSAVIRTFANSEKNTLVAELKDSLCVDPTGEEKIKTVRLDEFLAETKLERIDFLKIDVEGFEMKVLEGCGRYLDPSTIPYIFFEFHRIGAPRSHVSGHTQLCEVNSFLDSQGYRFVTIYTQGVHKNEPIGTYNALYGPLG
jgi:FkbM family methyltransferase